MVNNPSGNAGAMTFHTYDLGATIPERMRIDNVGNVGIGVTQPATPLQIYQSTNATAGDQKPTPVLTLSAHTNSDNEGPAIEFNSAWVNNSAYLATTINNGWGVAKIAGVYDDDQGNGGALSFYTNEGPSATSGATSSQLTEKMRIKPNGNVGIGTTNPTSNLHVDGSIVSTNLAQGTGELQIQGYGATGYINMSGSGSLKFRMGSSYTEHMSLTSGGQLLASAAGRYTGLTSNSWVTFGRLYSAQSTPLNIKVIVGHNSSGGYNEFTNDTYAYNVAAGTVVTIGNTTGGYTCQIRKIKRIGGQNGIPGAHYNGGDGGWEYQVARNQAYGMSVGIHVMGATTGWTWTI
jgi:hypothetical protein